LRGNENGRFTMEWGWESNDDTIIWGIRFGIKSRECEGIE